MSQRLKILYKEKAIPALIKKLNYKNTHQLPKLSKIKINRGLGLSAQNNNILKKNIEEFALITGQKPILTKSKKAIASFKIRQDMELGISVTLRGERMYAFLDKLINITLPQIRDFGGLSSKSFDRDGNLNIGLKEQLIFPEINYEDVDQIRGFDITIVTTAKNRLEGLALLKELGFPFTQ
jgi:large subunit ribosomal protein L5